MFFVCAAGVLRIIGQLYRICRGMSHMTMHDCNENAICEDLDGSYLCSCKSGYVGNGVTCVSKCNDNI